VIEDHRSPWDLIKEQLHKQLSVENYENWIAHTRFAGIDGKTMVAAVPDRQTANFLAEEYGQRINALAASLGLGLERVEFTAEPSTRALSASASAPELTNGNGHGDLESPIMLNPKFTFETFVVGACNQFAHAAAQSVAINPSRAYNPLYIYGGVGMGKTHLMHAIGRALLARGHMRIIYTTSERFTNEVITGIKHERMSQLRERYRSADVLLIDDIQTLGSKERTQEEFFSHLQRTPRCPEANRYLQRLPAAGDHGSCGSSAVALRVGPHGRHPASRSGNQDRHPRQESRVRRNPSSARRLDVHRAKDQVERA